MNSFAIYGELKQLYQGFESKVLSGVDRSYTANLFIYLIVDEWVGGVASFFNWQQELLDEIAKPCVTFIVDYLPCWVR